VLIPFFLSYSVGVDAVFLGEELLLGGDRGIRLAIQDWIL
jgi:hypothetical protein